MEIRKARNEDEEKIIEIHQEFYTSDFPLDFSNSFAHVLAEDKKILGFGWLDLIVEANVILDLNARDRDKFAAFKGILSYGEQVAKSHGFKQMHVFPKDAKFSHILKKHLKFTNVTGDCLVKNLEHGEKR